MISYRNKLLRITTPTSTSEGTIFIMPPAKSCEALRSEGIWWPYSAWGSISFPVPFTLTTSVGGFSLEPELEATGKLTGGSTLFISSNFSSNWLQNNQREFKGEKRGRKRAKT
jgi:hypothetical protein